MTLGKLADSPIIHIANQHDIMICLGYGVEEIVLEQEIEGQDLCRLCFGQSLRYSHPRA